MKVFLCILTILALATSVFAGTNSEEEYFRQATRLFDKGFYEQAIKGFQIVIKINPNRADAYAGIGMSYIKLGSNESMAIPTILENAKESFRQSLNIKPDFPNSHFGLGIVSLLLDDKITAIDEYNFLKGRDNKLASSLLEKINEFKEPVQYKLKNESAGSQRESYSLPQQVYAPSVNSPSSESDSERQRRCLQEMDRQISYPSGITKMSSSERNSAEANYESRKVSFMNNCMGQQRNTVQEAQPQNTIKQKLQDRLQGKGFDGIALPGGRAIIFDK